MAAACTYGYNSGGALGVVSDLLVVWLGAVVFGVLFCSLAYIHCKKQVPVASEATVEVSSQKLAAPLLDPEIGGSDFTPVKACSACGAHLGAGRFCGACGVDSANKEGVVPEAFPVTPGAAVPSAPPMPGMQMDPPVATVAYPNSIPMAVPVSYVALPADAQHEMYVPTGTVAPMVDNVRPSLFSAIY